MTASRAAGAGLLILGAAAGWIVAVRQMDGMDMGVATELGSFTFFVGAWMAMMAAMMLPGAIPAALRLARWSGRLGAVPLFAGSYLAVWTLVGLAAYAVYQPHGTAVAGALTVAAGIYEFTPLKGACRRRCRERVRSGFDFGLYCVGSSVGLMVMLLALGVMSITWSGKVAIVVLGQKLFPPRALVDVPVALAILTLGIAVSLEPSAVPGLT